MQMQLANARCYPMRVRGPPRAVKHESVQSARAALGDDVCLRARCCVPRTNLLAMRWVLNRGPADGRLLDGLQEVPLDAPRSPPLSISIESNGRPATRCGQSVEIENNFSRTVGPLTSRHGPLDGQISCLWLRGGPCARGRARASPGGGVNQGWDAMGRDGIMGVWL
jgi:hypothetical protein